jgi:hypothetical protein
MGTTASMQHFTLGLQKGCLVVLLDKKRSRWVRRVTEIAMRQTALIVTRVKDGKGGSPR